MSSTPKVSVGMPVYNGREWLRDSTRAILDQTHEKLELVISDNASTDDSWDILTDIAGNDERIVLFRQTSNIGAAANYNFVLEQASGDYFKWASCNDYICPTFLEKCVEVLEADTSVVLTYPKTSLFENAANDARPYEDNLHLVSQDPLERYRIFHENIALNNVMNGVIRTSALKRITRMRPYFGSDVVQMAELTLYGKFFEIPGRLFFRRMNPQSSTKLMKPQEVLAHWQPSLRPVRMPVLRSLLQRFHGYVKAPLDIRSRARLAALLARYTAWSRVELRREISEVFSRESQGGNSRS